MMDDRGFGTTFKRFQSWWQAHFSSQAAHRRHALSAPINPELWQTVCEQRPELSALSAFEQQTLAEFAAAFIAERPFYQAEGFTLTDERQVLIAALACLPVLHLNLDWLAGILAVVVYPDAFYGEHMFMDEIGVMHEGEDWRAGEAWENGTLVLSWADVIRSDHPYGGQVVIHEIAHFIDGVNGAENGFPPLPEQINRSEWTRAFTQAYRRLQRQIEHGEVGLIDPYAASNPAEFFAVLTETYFTQPQRVAAFDADVFALLNRFYHPQQRGLYA